MSSIYAKIRCENMLHHDAIITVSISRSGCIFAMYIRHVLFVALKLISLDFPVKKIQWISVVKLIFYKSI